MFPPFVDIRSVQTLIDGDRLLLTYGGQDLSPHDSGAYTGDVSGPMLKKLGCSYVTVGHSERREYHHEDDELVGLQVRKILLERAGYRVLTAQDGPSGLKIFSAEPVKAVVLDYSMPGMHGGEVAVKMRQTKPHVPILLLSAYMGLSV